MKYILVTYQKGLSELPEIRVFEDNQYYRAKLDWKHYNNTGVKAEIWETDGETAHKLNL